MLASSPAYPPAADLSPELIEVFRTDVADPAQAAAVRRALQARFPGLRVAFDLDDCDRVLRVQSPRRAGPARWAAVAGVVRRLGVAIEVLPD